MIDLLSDDNIKEFSFIILDKNNNNKIAAVKITMDLLDIKNPKNNP